MGLGNTATAFRFTSQLAGPLKCTTQGVVGHNASALVTSQPAAAWSTTCTVSVETLRRSMLTANGGGLSTVTPLTSDLATTLSLTFGPGFALLASTTATMLSDFNVAIKSARPLTLTVVVVGGLISTRSGPT